MNKLKAMQTLANAYAHIKVNASLSKDGAGPGDCLSLTIMDDKFHSIRRSLQNIDDAISAFTPQFNEGFNGPMPRYL